MKWAKYAIFLSTMTLPFQLMAEPTLVAAGPLDSMQDTKLHSRQEFVTSMAQMTLSILQDQKKSLSDRKLMLRQAFATVVDIDWIARFVLGTYWNKATDAQKKHYTELYRTYLSESYVSNFGENPDRRIKDIKILGIQDAEDNGFIVATDMKLANTEEVQVAYHVSDHEGKYKVIDIVIENVSLLATHRSQFSQIAANNGVDGVINHLEHALADNSINVSMR